MANEISPCGLSGSLSKAMEQIDSLKEKIAGGLDSIGDLGSIADSIKNTLGEIKVPEIPSFDLQTELAKLPYLSAAEYNEKIAELKRMFGDAIPDLDDIISKIPKPPSLSLSTGTLSEQLQQLAAGVVTSTQDIINALSPEAIANSISDLCKDVPKVEVVIVTDEKGEPVKDEQGKIVVQPPEEKPAPAPAPTKPPEPEPKPTPPPANGFTFKFTKEKLIAAGGPTAGQWYDAMVEMLPKYNITTPERVAAFIGNCRTETNWTTLEENLNYGADYLFKSLNPGKVRFPTYEDAVKVQRQPEKIANIIYMVGRKLFDPQPGDGWKYRGRGLIQLTFKENYLRASKAIYGDDRLVKSPDQVAKDKSCAIETACYYFKRTNVNAWADKLDWGNCRSITNAGSPGKDPSKIHGYATAVKYQEEAYKALKA